MCFNKGAQKMTLAVFAATEHYIVRAKVIILGSPLKYTLCISSIDGNRLFIITEDLKKKKRPKQNS